MNGTEVVLVTGPPRAGVTGMVAELRRRVPAYRFAEPGELVGTETPAAVVFVVSAVAPVAESDCPLAGFEDTEVLIGVVSKIDDHRDWRRVLDADREMVGRHSARFARVPWVGAAAAPRLGGPEMDELVAVLCRALADPARHDRNVLRTRESRIGRLRDERERLMLLRRRARLDHAAGRRREAQRARLSLTHAARRRCAGLRADLLDEATVVSRRDVADFPHRARQRCAEVLAGVDEDITEHTGDAPQRPPEIDVTDPRLRCWRLESRLTTVLGAGFGLGVAVVVARFVTGLAPGLAVAGLIAGAVVGVATTTWVIRARALLHDRATLQGWVGEVAAAVRAAAEERVGMRMLAAEAAVVSDGAGEGAGDAEIGRRIAAIDAEIRQLTGPRSAESVLPAGRSAGSNHLNRSCE